MSTAEQDEAVTEVIECLIEAPGQAQDILDALAPVIADIRRQAAAEALRAQSSRLHRVAAQHLETANTLTHGSMPRTTFLAYSVQARIDARYLGRAAEAIIHAGWEHTCAAETPATREDPGHGCEDPVEHEGGYCTRHEPEDDPRSDR